MLQRILSVVSLLGVCAPPAEVASSQSRQLQLEFPDLGDITQTTTTRDPNAVPETCDGGYFFDLEDWRCMPCAPGQASDGTAAQSECPPCQPGKFTNEHLQASCQRCPSGKYSNRGARRCSDCWIGTSPSPESDRCQQCSPGTYADRPGLGYCISCAAGTFSPSVAATTGSACQTCPAGMFTATSGRAECDSCSQGRHRSDSDPASACRACTDADDAPSCPSKDDGSGESAGVLVGVLVVIGVFVMYLLYYFCLRVANIAEYTKFGKEREDPDFSAGSDDNPDLLALPSGSWICSYKRKQCCGCRKNEYSSRLVLEFRGSGEITGKCEDADGEHMLVGSYNLVNRSARLAILYRWGGIEVNSSFLPDDERSEEVVLEGYFVTLVGTEGTVNIRFEPDHDHQLPKKPLRRPSLLDKAMGSAAEAALRKSGSQESMARLSQRRSSRKGSSAGVPGLERKTSTASMGRMSINSTGDLLKFVQNKMDKKQEKKEKAKQQAQGAKENEAQSKEKANEESQPQKEITPPSSEPEATNSGRIVLRDAEPSLLEVWEEAPGEAYQKPLGDPKKKAHPSMPPLDEDLPAVPDSKNIGTGYKVLVNGMSAPTAPSSAGPADTSDIVATLEFDEAPAMLVKGKDLEEGPCCRNLLCVPTDKRVASGPLR